jgi:hypothetical protein
MYNRTLKCTEKQALSSKPAIALILCSVLTQGLAVENLEDQLKKTGENR